MLLSTTRVSRRREILPSSRCRRPFVHIVDEGIRKSRKEFDGRRGDRDQQWGQRNLEASGQLMARDRPKMSPSLVIGDAFHFVTVQSGKHFEVPLSKEVDPGREEILAVSSVNDGLKTFLEDEIRGIEN